MGKRALIIEARFYDGYADNLLAGAKAEFEANDFAVTVWTVPGVLEIPIALAMAANDAQQGGTRYDAFCVLGTVIRGETGHYDIVAGEGNRGVTDVAVAHRLPLGNGILTVEDGEQAAVRADPARKNKGGGAAAAAIALYDLSAALGR